MLCRMLWLVLVVALAACLQCRGEAPSFHAETSFQRKLRDNEYSIFSLAKSDTSNAPSIDQEREQLYEAYNLLHTLAQVSHASSCDDLERTLLIDGWL